MKIISRSDGWYLAADSGPEVAGPYPTAAVAQLELLSRLEARLSPSQQVTWRVAHEATVAWWNRCGFDVLGRLATDHDVYAALLAVLRAIRRGRTGEDVFKRAAGSEWRIWASRLEGV